jgi:hypothetical protein
VIRTDKFLISKRLYAVDPDTLTIEARHYDHGTTYDGRIRAVWFRRKNGVTAACIGSLWDYQHTFAQTVDQWLTQHEDGRYGGDCHGRWDGESYWGNVTRAEYEQHMKVLEPMLANYPNIPPDYDGWWKF